MTSARVSAPSDPKGRLISIFVGAVLLPSIALSYVSLDFVPALAMSRLQHEVKRVERSLYFLDRDLEQFAQARALDAARAVGADTMLEARGWAINEALQKAGMNPGAFETLRLEAGSLRRGASLAGEEDPGMPRDELEGLAGAGGWDDSAVWTAREGKPMGTVRFRFAPEYVENTLVREFFEKGAADASVVVRVSSGTRTVYETAPTPDNRFEAQRTLEGRSLRGLTLALRYRDRSIEKDITRWKHGTLALVGFIDLMLAAGLYLVYSNVRREMMLSRLKSDFVANVSHELKTPLALIRLYSETLELGRVANPEKAKQYYRVINKESQRLTQLINNILDFSRIEAGRKEYRFAPTDIGKVAADVLEAYRFHVEQQGFTLEEAIQDDLPEVSADKEALGQALLNLINNAIKYSRDDRHVKVRVTGGKDRVEVSVADHGIGVAKAEHRKIFEKFYRAEDSLVHETKGSGLGLPLVRHIMEAHGGQVEVESAPGRGSTFTLVFPVHPPDASALAPARLPSEGRG